MKNAPTLYTLNSLREVIMSGNSVEKDGKWHPARPMGYYSLKNRLRIAYLVFIGKLDAVVWSCEEDEIEHWTDGIPCWCEPEVVKVDCCSEWTGKDSYDCDKDGARTKQGTCRCHCHSN